MPNKHGLVCKYHGRKFSHQGQMLSMPEFKEVQNFPQAVDNLTSFPLKMWATGFYLHFYAQLPPAFSGWPTAFNGYPFLNFSTCPRFDKEYNIKANWALYCENYPWRFPHSLCSRRGSTRSSILAISYETICHQDAILQIGYAKGDELCFDLPTDHIDAGKK